VAGASWLVWNRDRQTRSLRVPQDEACALSGIAFVGIVRG
jgi:hypothetical protein